MPDRKVVDGRHARRARGERAVIDAMFELLEEGKLSPSVEEVGARAGVSVATIFRNHGNLDALARHADDLFVERFGELFRLSGIGEGSLSDRTARFCDARLDLYEAIWPYVQFMTLRAAKHPEAAANLERLRKVLADQVRRQFKRELRAVGQAESHNLTATMDALTSPESWALMQAPHSRSRRQIKRAWTNALGSLLAS